jgi:hypothetical protein
VQVALIFLVTMVGGLIEYQDPRVGGLLLPLCVRLSVLVHVSRAASLRACRHFQ